MFDPYPQDQEIRYTYLVEVNASGKVTGHHFWMAHNGFAVKEVEAACGRLRFTPAISDQHPAESCVFVRCKFNLAEGGH